MSWIWRTKTMGWIEQKLINLTTTIYMKRREPDPLIASLGLEPPVKTRKSTRAKSATRSKRKEA